MTQLSDLKVLAWNGCALVAGELAVKMKASGEILAKATAGATISVDLEAGGFATTRIVAYDAVRRDADGLFSEGTRILAVEFGDIVPALGQLMGPPTFRGGRYRFEAQDRWVATVYLPTTKSSDAVFGRGVTLTSLDLQIDLQSEGLRIGFSGPMFIPEINGGGELLLVGDILVPLAYLKFRHMTGLTATVVDHVDPPQIGAWKPSAFEPFDFPVGQHGNAFFAGELDWSAKGQWNPQTGPWVRARVAPRATIAEPVTKIVRLADGFVEKGRHRSRSPQMELYLGYDDFGRILGSDDEAELRLFGAGIGHVDGETGRDAYENPMRQRITELVTRFKRMDTGLIVSGEGELAPLSGQDEASSLGPKLRFKMIIPRAWMLAQGWADVLWRFLHDRRAQFPPIRSS